MPEFTEEELAEMAAVDPIGLTSPMTVIGLWVQSTVVTSGSN